MSRYALVKDDEVIDPNVAAPNVDQSLLAAGKPRRLPVMVIGADFDPETQVRSGPVYTVVGDTVTETWSVRDKNDGEVAAMKADKVAAIKEEARRRILQIMPEYAQLNALALGQEMTLLHGPDPANWPAEAQAIYADVMPKWTSIKAIRTASDLKEAALMDLESAGDVAAYDPFADWE